MYPSMGLFNAVWQMLGCFFLQLPAYGLNPSPEKHICDYKGSHDFQWNGDEQISAQNVRLNPCYLGTFQPAQYF